MTVAARAGEIRIEEVNLQDAAARGRYDRLFEACPGALIQQSSYWADAIAPIGPDRPIFLLCSLGDDAVAGLPLYLYRGPDGPILTSVPQAGPLGGIFISPTVGNAAVQPLYEALLEQSLEVARRHDCLALTVITSPFREDVDLYRRALAPALVFENFTQSIEVADVVRAGQITLRDYHRRSNLSRNLQRARQAGFTVTFADENELELWYTVHAQRQRELNVTPLSLDLLRNLMRELIPRDKARFVVVKHQDEVASGCLYVYHREILDVYMLSMATRYAGSAPNYLNTEFSLRWAGERGVRHYNWQSSPGRASGVYRYKQQWGSTEAPYYFVTHLLCRTEALTRIGREHLAQGYPGHYVVPFGVFDHGFAEPMYRKP